MFKTTKTLVITSLLIISILNFKVSIRENCHFSNEIEESDALIIDQNIQIENFVYSQNNSLENIIGDDDRQRITPTTVFPYQSIVKLQIKWGNDYYLGSGVLIDENHVLTAGHCVYYHTLGGWADSIKVIPAADNGNEPYGHAWAIKMHSYKGWIDFGYTQDDFAVITLDQDIGSQTGWMNLHASAITDPIYIGGLNIAGYPGDLDGGINMYWDYDNGRIANENNHWYYMDTGGGMSGAPVWIYNGSDYLILSVHTNGDDGSGSNHGTRINQNKLYSIENWILSDQLLIDRPDLASGTNTFAGVNVTTVGAGITNFRTQCVVHNVGTALSDQFNVSFYLSNDTIITKDDYLIGIKNVFSLSPTTHILVSWSGIFPENIPSGLYYIGRIIDENDFISEFNENNNINYVSQYKIKVDATPPVNPTNCIQLNGITENNVWQNSVNDPEFSWSGAYDIHTSIAGYYYYWGEDENGTSQKFTTVTSFNPPPVSDGIYYLRVKTQDSVGNNATWQTLYTFKYDSCPPLNPDTCNQLIGTTVTNMWQPFVSNPYFNWSGDFDLHSTIDKYYYYWGTAENGTSLNYTTIPNFDAPKIDSGVYYLRLKASDIAGNNATWKTIYIFKYDGTAPSNPTICYQTIGSTQSDVWQGNISDPFFMWSEASDSHTFIRGYYCYFGSNPNGTSNLFTTDHFYDPSALPSGIYYLRVKAQDYVGNNASWSTIYVFKYDENLNNNEKIPNHLVGLNLAIIISIGVDLGIALSLLTRFHKYRKGK